MGKYIFYAAVLIGLFLALVYYKGFSADVGAGGGAIGKLIMFLQGRNANGSITNYPH